MSSLLYKDKVYSSASAITDTSHVFGDNGSGTNVTTQQMLMNILGDFATVESSDVASKAYAIGDYLVLNSWFYKVTAAISQGDTITVGTNVVKTNIGNEFKTFDFPICEVTRAQYDALPAATQNDGTIYMITDDNGGWEAENSTYDNTVSGLTATNVQDALDELAEGQGNSIVTYISGTQQSGTLNANATAWVNVPYTLPSGYKAISISQCYATGPNSPIMIYQFSLSQSSDIISVAIRNMGSSSSSYTVDASVMCIKIS